MMQIASFLNEQRCYMVKAESWLGRRLLLSFLLSSFLCYLSSASLVDAAEICIKTECQASGLVRLGDVAEIHAAAAQERERLAAIELFPAPAVGGKAFVRAREVQDMLALRGLDLSQHRLTGSSQIEIRNGAKAAGPITSSAARRAAERVEAAIAACLRKQTAGDEGWTVAVTLEDEQVRLLSATRESIAARGGGPPWVGEQDFTIIVPGTTGKQTFAVTAKVAAVPLVVVAARAFVPGDIVQRADVKLGQAKWDSSDLPFHRLDDVLGMETKRAIVDGQVLKQDDLRSPLLVRRGDAVDVFARSAGIQVRTIARAQEDGGKGDLIVVESMLTRERFMARVSGIHEVEVFAQAADADAATLDGERRGTTLKPAMIARRRR